MTNPNLMQQKISKGEEVGGVGLVGSFFNGNLKSLTFNNKAG